MRQRGQMDIAKVLGIIGVLVAIIVGGLVFSEIHRVSEESVEGLGTTYNWSLSVENADSDNLSITAYDGIKTGTLSSTFTLSAEALVTLTLNDTTIENATYGAGENTPENNVLSYLQAGINTLTVAVDNEDRITTMTTTLAATSYDKSVGEETATGIGDVGSIIFTILPILVLVSIIFMLVWVFKRE